MNSKAVTVIGIGDDGCLGLCSRAVNAISKAQILAGGERHLSFFPQFAGKKIVFKNDISKAISEIEELSNENTICVLASGDPLFYGIGSLILKKINSDFVEFIPSSTSIQLAFSRIKSKWDDATVISLHGKPIQGLISKLQRAKKVAILTDKKNSPYEIAKYLGQYQETDWRAFVCENLGSKYERIIKYESILELKEEICYSDLNILILERKNTFWQPDAVIPYAKECEFVKRVPKKGLITKREVRVISLASLNLRSTSVVWDIGAGSGAIAIEASKLAWEGKVYAVEVDPEGVEICRENIISHRADHVNVVAGRAPEVLDNLENPDAVFVGGSKGSLIEIIRYCYGRLNSNGRIVVNAITLDNVTEAYQAYRALGILPDVTLLNIARGQELARYLRYEALNPIHIFAATKSIPQSEESVEYDSKKMG